MCIRDRLVGHEPEYLARDALALMEHDCAGVDLNMGCPAPMVCRRNAGGGIDVYKRQVRLHAKIFLEKFERFQSTHP